MPVAKSRDLERRHTGGLSDFQKVSMDGMGDMRVESGTGREGAFDGPALKADLPVLLSLFEQLHDALETGQSHTVVASILNVLSEYVDSHVQRQNRVLALDSRPESAERRTRSADCLRGVETLRDGWLGGNRDGLTAERLSQLKKWLTEWPPVADKLRG
jgi:hypothetical protein